MVNDVTALSGDPELASVVAAHRGALVLMHHRGRSAQMYDRAVYQDVAREVRAELQERIEVAVAAGISRECLLIDPGIGFAKRAAHSFDVLAALPVLATLDRPLLVGPSRKSFLQTALGDVPPGERVWGTAAAVTAAIIWGAHVVRVHDLPQMRDVVRVADTVRAARPTG
jgi:dihydropteroate synthase